MVAAVAKRWRDVSDRKNLEPYDLLSLRLANGNVKSGWWTGQGWDGLRLKQQDEVIGWRKHYDTDG